MSHIELHHRGESGSLGVMLLRSICPSCGEEMSARRSDTREEDYVFECRACRVSYVTREPARMTERESTR
jgi:hypothetical protein